MQLFAPGTSGVVLALIVISVLIILLLSVRAAPVVMLVVIAPLIMTFAIAGSVSVLEIPRWIGIMTWVAMGFLFSFVYFTIMR